MNKVLQSTQFVIEQAQFVCYDARAAARFVARHLSHARALPAWDTTHHFNDGSARTLMYLFVLDSLNFCFWDNEPRWRIRHAGQTVDGYVALAARLKQAFERGDPLDDPHHLADMPLVEVQELLAGEGQIPMVEERWRILRQAGQGLLDFFNGQIVCLIERAQGSALRLVGLLGEYFPSFCDEAEYAGQRVRFYKRAQIFCGDLYGTFAGQGWGRFDDIDQLTAFADYKLPQLLRAHGVLHYAPELADKVDALVELKAGSPEEVEIRAFTVHAVEWLKGLFAENGVFLKSIEVDWMLWHLSQGLKTQPYHRTRTVFY